jgi:hypothetical protein
MSTHVWWTKPGLCPVCAEAHTACTPSRSGEPIVAGAITAATTIAVPLRLGAAHGEIKATMTRELPQSQKTSRPNGPMSSGPDRGKTSREAPAT